MDDKGQKMAPNDVLKYAFWNINGYKSKVIGNKFVSRDFLKVIDGCDVIRLAEPHIHSQVLDDLVIPGFIRIHYKNRKPRSNGKCGSRGIALFSKENILKFLLPIQNDNEDVIWVKVKRELLGQEKDVYLGTAYISPTGNKETIAKKFEKIGEEIGLFQTKGNIILQGDLNAHTNNKDDIIITDEFDRDFGIEIPIAQHRNSEDSSKTDRRGEEFLELCKSQNMIIINGRKTGDPFGKITSYQWNGKAVVDYVISSFELFHNITFLKWVNTSHLYQITAPFSLKYTQNATRGKNTKII